MIHSFIDVVPGMQRDGFGNRYIIVGGDNPTTMISCHTDTVHTHAGRQIVGYDSKQDCYMLDTPPKAPLLAEQPVKEPKTTAPKVGAGLVVTKDKDTRGMRPGFFTAHPKMKGGKFTKTLPPVVRAGLPMYERECLGADDGAGIYAALCMIHAGIPALYVFHRAEEIGGQGSNWIVKHNRKLLKGIQRCIALDRRGEYDIITHQMMGRCCSDGFAWALAAKLNMIHEPCAFGSFTDSANYTDFIPECTNVSVGYQYEHSSREYVNFGYLECLVEALCAFNLSELPTIRRAGELEDWRDYMPTKKVKKVKTTKKLDDLIATASTAAATIRMVTARDTHNDVVRAARAYLDGYIDPYGGCDETADQPGLSGFDSHGLDGLDEIDTIDVEEADLRWHEKRLGMTADERAYQDWLADRWSRD